MHSAIYQGRLRHRRFYPKRHEFSYDATLFYIDLDELPELFTGVCGWSFNKFNLGCFYRSDYLGDTQLPLKAAVRSQVLAMTGSCPQGAVRMLTNLRIWGFCFNPVTFYYLFEVDADKPSVILAQVNNTPWQERHCYVVYCAANSAKTTAQFAKEFHVSPFNPMAMEYHWVSTNPAEHLLVHMENHAATGGTDSCAEGEKKGCHMDATLTLKRVPWSASQLQKILCWQPWAALKVPLLIYWQALRLFFKGVPVYSHSTLNPLHTDGGVELKTTGEKS